MMISEIILTVYLYVPIFFCLICLYNGLKVFHFLSFKVVYSFWKEYLSYFKILVYFIIVINGIYLYFQYRWIFVVSNKEISTLDDIYWTFFEVLVFNVFILILKFCYILLNINLCKTD